MKAQELMLGDWVFCRSNNMPARVEGISKREGAGRDGYTFILRDKNNTGLFVRAISVEPIPLTSEILEKNGFIRFGTDYILEGRHFGLENPSIPSNYLDNYWLRVSIKAVRIEFVHELQHVLRLCGIEKKINL